MLAYLILLKLRDFDIILGMDWLAAHYANVDCFNKDFSFKHPNKPMVIFKGTRKLPKFIYAL